MKEKLIIELVLFAVFIGVIFLVYPKLSAMNARAQHEESERLNRIRLFGRDDI